MSMRVFGRYLSQIDFFDKQLTTDVVYWIVSITSPIVFSSIFFGFCDLNTQVRMCDEIPKILKLKA